ncbi:MAG: serine protease [Candidatus Eremiobacterota bacterium]
MRALEGVVRVSLHLKVAFLSGCILTAMCCGFATPATSSPAPDARVAQEQDTLHLLREAESAAPDLPVCPDLYAILRSGERVGPGQNEYSTCIPEWDPTQGFRQLFDRLSQAERKLAAFRSKYPDSPEALGFAAYLSTRAGYHSAQKAGAAPDPMFLQANLETLDRAIDRDRRNGTLWRYRGVVKLMAAAFQTGPTHAEAMRDFQQALVLYPDDSQARFYLAMARLGTSRARVEGLGLKDKFDDASWVRRMSGSGSGAAEAELFAVAVKDVRFALERLPAGPRSHLARDFMAGLSEQLAVCHDALLEWTSEDSELTPRELFEHANRGVVILSHQRGLGTGFVVKKVMKDIYVLTNRHVVKGDAWQVREVAVRFLTGECRTGTVTAWDRSFDVAMIRITVENPERYPLVGRGPRAVEFLSARYRSSVPAGPVAAGSWVEVPESDVAPGVRVLVIGHPGTASGPLTWSLTEGTVSKLTGDGHILVNAETNPGNSGGPILDLRGRLLGIVVGGLYRNRATGEVLEGVTVGVTGRPVSEIIQAAR